MLVLLCYVQAYRLENTTDIRAEVIHKVIHVNFENEILEKFETINDLPLSAHAENKVRTKANLPLWECYPHKELCWYLPQKKAQFMVSSKPEYGI